MRSVAARLKGLECNAIPFRTGDAERLPRKQRMEKRGEPFRRGNIDDVVQGCDPPLLHSRALPDVSGTIMRSVVNGSTLQ
jgi:hypothetical protein